VFISHAVEDRTAAKAICDGLEKLGVVCWIAPRDIKPGATWAKALMDGVEECSEMVLVLSEHANESDPVISEVHAASERKRRIIPVRIRDVRPAGALEFYIGRAHWFNAFPEEIDTYLSKLAQDIVGAPPPRVPSSNPPAATKPLDNQRHVQVFFHGSNVEKTAIVATLIANDLEASGWSVERGYTELEIHSRGVWVHGGTNAERQFAIGILAARGIEARFDDRAEDVPLQIIVGYGEHGRRSTPAQKQPANPESRGTERINWSIDTSSISSVPRLNVRLYFVENKGGTPGLSIKIVNDEPETIEAAQVDITNILRWHEQHKKFVKSRDIYDSATVFRALEINRVTLHPGEVEDAGFVRCESQRVEFNGKMADQGQAHYRIRTPGIWQVSFRVQGPDGRNQDGSVCFKWDGGQRLGELAIPWECPKPDNIDSD
jgi:hypothetical protein